MQQKIICKDCNKEFFSPHYQEGSKTMETTCPKCGRKECFEVPWQNFYRILRIEHYDSSDSLQTLMPPLPPSEKVEYIETKRYDGLTEINLYIRDTYI